MLKDAFVLDGSTAIGRTVRCANLALYRRFSKERAKRAKKRQKPRRYAMKEAILMIWEGSNAAAASRQLAHRVCAAHQFGGA
ncbi:hypothetical protein hmeg3_18180 [Herbaspirillum sp. meg3]|jgi:hypothetical protein|uniref:hypothetical protein n=1 Tax=Herbaspirillum sp. meg3 TaxID=2025949 RepID=UPI000B99C6FD|nr:hypothetical protein [Herbaspirillum sp. meg3]ASU40025.1 hypothetical protein hmeg3_18180 [Herbaspirillum sp. meg3]